MADTKLTGLTATTTPVLTDEAYIVTTPGGTPASHYVTLDTLQQILSVKNVADGRLTLESGIPISTTDQANKTTLYYTFFKGNKIGLYDGASWHVRTFTELSIAVGALTASKPYDVFIYDNSGTPALELLVWTDAANRATALAYQDGVLVKSGAATRRYVGTIYIDSGQKAQDTLVARNVWNFYNKENRRMYLTAAAGHNYNSATYRPWNNDAANAFTMVIGVAQVILFNVVNYSQPASAGKLPQVNLSVNATNTGDLTGVSVSAAAQPFIVGTTEPLIIPAGFNTITVTERDATAANSTFNGYYAGCLFVG